MKQLSTDEIKKIQKDILDTITEYCDEEGLIYYLGYGTLLGAVRHQGYIPWDDDIDILMPRPDYDKLLNNFKTEDYKIYTNEVDSDYYYTFAKASYEKSILKENLDNAFDKLGVNIDIFPLDGCPETEEERKKKFKQIENRLKLLYVHAVPSDRKRKWYKDLFLQLVKFGSSFMNQSNLVRSIDKISAKNDYHEASMVGNLVFNSGYHEIMNKEIFAERIKLVFEDKKYFVPTHYDKYLTNIYGDYMKLPPVEKRVTHHDFQAFIK